MNKNFFGIFIAQQSTTFKNIELIIENYSKTDANEFIFINQSNIYNNNLDDFIKIKDKYIYKFKKPIIKVNNPYSPSLFIKVIYFIKIKFFLGKYLKKAKFVCFSPGGFIEGEIARIVKKNGGKVIQIEGGLPNDLINNKSRNEEITKTKIYYKLPFKRFSSNPRIDPLVHVDYFISSGQISKKMHETLGYNDAKILDIGIPRFENLIGKKSATNYQVTKVDNLIYIAGAYEFHNEKKQSEKMLSDIKEIYKFLNNKKEILFQVKLHPRQSNNEINKIVNEIKAEIINNDQKFQEVVFKNSIAITRYSNLAYELLYQNIPTFFYKPPTLEFKQITLPDKNLVINSKLELEKLLNDSEKLINLNYSEYAKLFYSKNTPNSSSLITKLLVEG